LRGWCVLIWAAVRDTTPACWRAGARVVALDVAELFIAAAATQERQGIRYLVGDGAFLTADGAAKTGHRRA
jgi:hypothetical protein